MDKIFDRVLIEFVIPALLMLVCLLLIADVLLGPAFNLSDPSTRGAVLDSTVLMVGMLLAYIVNTSLSCLYNLISRVLLWGRIREYLMYRKLDLFKEEALLNQRMWCLKYLVRRKDLKDALTQAKAEGKRNLYQTLVRKLRDRNVPEQSMASILDIYDVVRTLVMASQDSAIIGWIQYHWGQLRLARSTLVPSLLLVYFLPAAVCDWCVGSSGLILGLGVLMAVLFVVQLSHYYYRERFMIYAMLSYFLASPSGSQSEVTGGGTGRRTAKGN